MQDDYSTCRSSPGRKIDAQPQIPGQHLAQCIHVRATCDVADSGATCDVAGSGGTCHVADGGSMPRAADDGGKPHCKYGPPRYLEGSRGYTGISGTFGAERSCNFQRDCSSNNHIVARDPPGDGSNAASARSFLFPQPRGSQLILCNWRPIFRSGEEFAHITAARTTRTEKLGRVV